MVTGNALSSDGVSFALPDDEDPPEHATAMNKRIAVLNATAVRFAVTSRFS
ncbi:MAG: hypothetical protein KDB02_12295 [Acidimicrobiales bacterium]|nr:hypothetical protein [Acidimicrobiales bacterium]